MKSLMLRPMLDALSHTGCEVDKYIKLMADYCSSGLWNKEGECIAIEQMPVSAELLVRVDAWVRKYDIGCTDYLSSTDEGYNHDFNMKAFSDEGWAIAHSIKEELPDWTVMYFDEMQFEQGEHAASADAVITIEERVHK